MRLGKVLAPARAVAAGAGRRWWFGTITWEQRVYPEQVKDVLRSVRSALAVQPWFAVGAWVAEVEPHPEDGWTETACPCRGELPRWAGAEARAAYARCRAGSVAGADVPAPYEHVWTDRRGATRGTWLEPDDRRWTWAGYWAALGVCDVCGGRGVLPVGHVHVHLVATGPRALWLADTERGRAMAARHGATNDVAVSTWFLTRGFGRTEFKPVESEEGCTQYLAKGAGDYVSKGGGIYCAAYLRAEGRVRAAGKLGLLGVAARTVGAVVEEPLPGEAVPVADVVERGIPVLSPTVESWEPCPACGGRGIEAGCAAAGCVDGMRLARGLDSGRLSVVTLSSSCSTNAIENSAGTGSTLDGTAEAQEDAVSVDAVVHDGEDWAALAQAHGGGAWCLWVGRGARVERRWRLGALDDPAADALVDRLAEGRRLLFVGLDRAGRRVVHDSHGDAGRWGAPLAPSQWVGLVEAGAEGRRWRALEDGQRPGWYTDEEAAAWAAQVEAGEERWYEWVERAAINGEASVRSFDCPGCGEHVLADGGHRCGYARREVTTWQ